MINLTDAINKIGIILCLAMAVSCVDESYNLDKINDDLAINWESLSMPIGNLETIRISQFVKVEDNELVRVAANGDYSVHFDGNESKTVFNVPAFKMSTNVSDSNSKSVTYSPLIISGNSPAVDIEFKHGMEIHETSIPKEILSVESVKVNATLKPIFTFEGTDNLKGIMLKAGTTLEFPSWVTISSYDSKTLSKSGTVLTLKQDTALGKDGIDLTCSASEIDFKKLPNGQGLIKNGEVYVNDSLIVKGQVYIRESDIVNKVTKDTFKATFSFSISEIEVLSAKASVKPTFNLNLPSVDTKALSSFFQDGSELDIYDASINLSINNDSPLSASISTDIDSYKGGSKARSAHLGPIEVKASSKSDFTFGKRSGTRVENLTDIISNLPDSLCINNFSIGCSEDVVEYVAGSTYTVSANYSIDAPLAFGKNLNTTFDYDLKVGLGLQDMNVGSIDVKFLAENSIPLGMKLSATVVDENGNPVTGPTVNIAGEITPGDLSSPTSNDIKIAIVPGVGTERIETIRLRFTASCDESHEGVCLNKNQGLSIQNISLKVNDIQYAL